MASTHPCNTAFPGRGSFEASLAATLFGYQNQDGHAEKSAWGRRSRGSTEFSPAADVFDTPTSYVVHVSLPGARKEDIGINYDEDKSEIQISGVVLRNGDEEFLKSLAISERAAGLFEKKVILGDRRQPAAVDTDGIAAKLENGVLEVVIPKKEKEVVEKKKVRID